MATVSQADQPVLPAAPENPDNNAPPVSTGGKLVVFFFFLGFLLLGSMIVGELVLKLFRN